MRFSYLVSTLFLRLMVKYIMYRNLVKGEKYMSSKEGKKKMSKLLGIGTLIIAGLALGGWKYLEPMLHITKACYNTYELIMPDSSEFNVHSLIIDDFKLGKEDTGVIAWLMDDIKITANITSYEQQMFAELYGQLFDGVGMSYAVYKDEEIMAIKNSLKQTFEIVDKPFSLEEANKQKIVSNIIKSVMRDLEIFPFDGGYNVRLTEKSVKDMLVSIVDVVMRSNEFREHVAILYYINQEEVDAQPANEFNIDVRLDEIHLELLTDIYEMQLEQGLEATLYINDENYLYGIQMPFNVVFKNNHYFGAIEMDSELSKDGVARLNIFIDDMLSEFNISLDYNEVTGITKVSTVISPAIYIEITHLKEANNKFVLLIDTALKDYFSLKLDGIGNYYRSGDKFEVNIENMLLNFSTKGNLLSLDMVSADLTYLATFNNQEIVNPVE